MHVSAVAVPLFTRQGRPARAMTGSTALCAVLAAKRSQWIMYAAPARLSLCAA